MRSVVLFVLLGLAVHAQCFSTSANAYAGANQNGGMTVSEWTGLSSSSTPGNVGLCFSGGGSRALSAAMGQLRALNQMGVLSEVKAISSVSGGSWGTVPFTFLPDSISDADFLGPYVSDPADLVVALGGTTATTLSSATSPVNLGAAIINNDMSLLDLTSQAVTLGLQGVPANRLWTTLIGNNILGTFGLSNFDSSTHLPTAFFCPDTATCNSILSSNPSFSSYHVMRAGRPFHIINTAMFVDMPSLSSSFKYLVPVQATPYFAGVVSSPTGAVLPASGYGVGGQVVSAYAFNSLFQSGGGGNDVVSQTCPFALSDITGASSAAIGEILENDVAKQIPSAADLDPAFNYFGSADIDAGNEGGLGVFSDAGTLDNSGVCAMLVYSDIDTLIVFANTDTPLSTDASGNVVVTTSLAPLFGYFPYSSSSGYEPLPDVNSPSSSTSMNEEFRFNQVFESSQFSVMQQGLMSASAAGGKAGSAPAVFLQQGLRVLPNSWWGIQGGNTVNVLWVYNTPASEFNKQLSWEVSAAMPGDFPNYGTQDTGLSALEVNLLAHFTAWVLMQNENTITALFTPSGYLQSALLATGVGKNQLVGIALGVSLGVVVLAALAAVVIMRRRLRLTRAATSTVTRDDDVLLQNMA